MPSAATLEKTVSQSVFAWIGTWLIGALAFGCHCSGRTSAAGIAGVGDSAGPSSTVASADALTSLAKTLREPLIARAERAEPQRADTQGEWDEAVNLAFAARARVELLRSGVVTEERQPAIRHATESIARVLLDYEALGRRGRRYCDGACGSWRGWGTSRKIRIGSVSAASGLDAYSTGIVLGALADVAEEISSQSDSSAMTALYELAVQVADSWIAQHLFRGPGGGPSFEKIARSTPEIRRYTVFNTDALLARALLTLGAVARRRGDPARALQYEHVAVGVGSALRRWILDAVERAPAASSEIEWHYGLEQTADGRVLPQRFEDSNHASFTLDFIALAVERRLSAGAGDPPLFSQQDLSRLGALLRQVVVPRGMDGQPAYRLYVNAFSVDRSERGKSSAREFSLAPEGSQRREVISWWKELAGDHRSLDLGLSIRTSWGWAEAVADDAEALAAIGQYLLLAARDPELSGSRNLFLSQATWLRVVERRGRR
jgi:hypothetical protein